MESDLIKKRIETSLLSGGTSDNRIKQLILNELLKHSGSGRLLDFGAGRGHLLCQLYELGIFDKLVGADLFPKSENIPQDINWIQQDLNDFVAQGELFNVVICSEVIEHLENPRQVFRNIYSLLKPGGLLILTTPNQESLRSYLALIFGGHFAGFLGSAYPAHITALLRLDLLRICAETGFNAPVFSYTNHGGIPKLPSIAWQSISFGLFSGRLFSDNLCITTRK